MNNAQRSLFVFALFMFSVGFSLILIPMPIMHFFRLSAGEDAWIRFIGMLLSVIGVYYIMVVRAKLDRFIPWTVPARLTPLPSWWYWSGWERLGRPCYCLRRLTLLLPLGLGLLFVRPSKNVCIKMRCSDPPLRRVVRQRWCTEIEQLSLFIWRRHERC